MTWDKGGPVSCIVYNSKIYVSEQLTKEIGDPTFETFQLLR